MWFCLCVFAAMKKVLRTSQVVNINSCLNSELLWWSVCWLAHQLMWQSAGFNPFQVRLFDVTSAHLASSARPGTAAAAQHSLDPRQQDQQRRQQQRKQSKAAAQQQAQRVKQQQQWEPPSRPAQLSFGVKLNTKAESNAHQQQQQQPAMHSAFMEARRIVCDKPRVRGDKGPVVPTWFLLGSGWQVQQQDAARQQQQPQKQPQKQKAKVQAGKKANPDAASAPGKPAGGSKGGQVKQQYEAYSREQQHQQQKHASKPAAAVPLSECRRRRDRFAEEAREHQPQQGQLAWEEEDRWPAAEDEEAAWHAHVLGRPDDEEDEDARWAAAAERRQRNVWRWSAAAELSWAEDEPDWPDEMDEAV